MRVEALKLGGLRAELTVLSFTGRIELSWNSARSEKLIYKGFSMPGQQWFLLLFSLDRKFVPLTMKPLVFCKIKKIMLGFATIWTLFSCFFHLNSHERGQDTLNRSSQFHGQLNHPPSCKKNFHWWFIFCCLAAISYPNKSKEWILNELFARYKQLCQSLFSRKLESSWMCSWDELQSTPTPSLGDVLWSFLLWGDKTQRGSVAATDWAQQHYGIVREKSVNCIPE